MPFSLTVVHEAELLLVTAEGLASLGDLCGLFDLVRATAERHGHHRALLDLRRVEIRFGFTDHLALGAHAAAEVRHMTRVASVVDPKFRVGTSEKAARKMGANFRTFTEAQVARQWVLGKEIAET